VWILGASGRVGSDVARRLVDGGRSSVVLVGRDQSRLSAVAGTMTTPVRTVVSDDLDRLATAVRAQRPRVVVNVMGNFAVTGPLMARAARGATRYVDLASDLASITALHDLADEAAGTGSTLVTGAGFGVLGVEAPLVALCDGRGTPSRVRVDALASFAAQDGVMGEAFAGTAVDVIATGGRRYQDGLLVPARLGARFSRHSLPDGTRATSAAVPSGELFAAQRVTGAPDVEFTTALAPSSPVVRAMLPLMSRLARRPSIRRRMISSMAASRTTAAPRPRQHSWGRAVVEWPDGSRREAWLRTGDAMEFTARSVTAVVLALQTAQVPTGAFTPAAAFGPQIAVAAGGELIFG
jgi:short subunit dehydrogenase-like uncharacterized protein